MSDDERGPTLVDLPKKNDEAAALRENFNRNFESVIETQKTIARIRRAAYLAYVAEGFTEIQALELCMK